MPNWCWNTATISHDDPAMVDRLEKVCETGILNEFIPCPKELLETVSSPGTTDKDLQTRYEENKKKYGHPDWYDWCIHNWGTKWDITAECPERNGNEIYLSFDSAWAPPIGAYNKMLDLGFKIEAYYHESGMGFAGKYDNGEDEYVEYDFEDENWRDDISDDVADMLESEYESYLEMKAEEEEQEKTDV